MADQLTVSALGELVVELCEFLKEREKSFAELSKEVADMHRAPATGQSIRRETAAHLSRIDQLDAIIGRIRQ